MSFCATMSHLSRADCQCIPEGGRWFAEFFCPLSMVGFESALLMLVTM